MADDLRWMQRALALAEHGIGRVHPNPLVGAVVVRDGQVVGEGFHAAWGDEHAEAVALRLAGEQARGATLYVTLEPCAHHGKQPPCVDAVIASGVARVVVALRDPNPVANGGLERLAEAGVAVSDGVAAAEAARQNFRFLHAFGDRPRPWVGVKLAVSIDGMIADAAGHSRWISGPPAREAVQRLRAGVAAVGVGGATAAADDPLLTVRREPQPAPPPTRVVFDRSARMPATAAMLHDESRAPVCVLLSPSHDAAHRVALETAGARVHVVTSLEGGLNALQADGIDSILVEGGGRLASALLDADLVDRVYLFQAPFWLGTGVPAWTRAITPDVNDAPRWRRSVTTFADPADLLQILERP
ncbi:MAG TPA: bifunctional diaminohydroxyphosphoribosylaminopyrimidine deaminase/5-amino-6-(5-phosphoribosylamino)uracil reductase RibD [Gemmatimonadales bacterium]|jgi:diaminohydroxyphosphoribosylaminopyrimidine deaminase/5-amino-6-(5-phosphoribosylamino)uracil reductase